ncbi:MAG: hypothetical protein QF719_04805 [Chloroflexota bacterium]|jgi:hypothetical protein|nr:hypothetical protein [Chloroflexota bacterium]MDP6757519.1 hypothetical protein [Chloroflexota bacterium]
MEFGPAQITAVLLAVIFIALGLAGGRSGWRPRRRSSPGQSAPDAEHQQFMRPADRTDEATAAPANPKPEPADNPFAKPDQDA